MPTISQFYGIIIRMFYDDYAPPHFHAMYHEHELVVGLAPVAILEGQVPARVRSMVLEWVGLHHQELLDDWERCRRGEAPLPIAPLE